MQRHCVLGLEVDAFDDVDFAIVGPLVTLEISIFDTDYLEWALWLLEMGRGVAYRGARRPKSGPNATGSTWHVLQVKDHETMCILVSARDTYAVAATARGDVGGVGADGHDSVVHAD